MLEAATEILGGEAELAQYMDIDELVLRAYLDGREDLPPLLALYTLDLVMGNRAFARADAALDRAIDKIISDVARRRAA